MLMLKGAVYELLLHSTLLGALLRASGTLPISAQTVKEGTGARGGLDWSGSLGSSIPGRLR